MLVNTNYFLVIFSLISLIVIIIISLKWTNKFILVLVPSYIVIIVIMKLTGNLYKKKYAAAREEVVKLNPKILEFIENRKTIEKYSNIFQFENTIIKDMHKRDKFFTFAFAANAFGKSSIEAIKSFSLVLFIILSYSELLSGKLEVSSFIALFSYFLQAFIPLNSFQTLINENHKFKILLNRIKNSIKIKQVIDLPENSEFNLNNCYFSYKNKKKNSIIENISLDLNKKMIGIVGLSGEGKSTLIKILSGEIIPEKGNCTLGNANVANIPSQILFSQLKIYEQNAIIFNKNLEFNITLGKKPLMKDEYFSISKKIEKDIQKFLNELNKLIKNGNYDRRKVINLIMNKNNEFLFNIFPFKRNKKDISILAIEIVNSIISKINNDNLIEILKDAYLSNLYYNKERYDYLLNLLDLYKLEGRNFGQRGEFISGGEKNLICLARFLLNEKIKKVIIDEPFTSLDPITENKCLSILYDNLQNCSGIVISHKLNIISKLCDEIYVLNEGSIIEKGTHSELISNKGMYSQLYNEYMKQKEDANFSIK